MQELLLVNPAKRPKKRRASRKAPSAAQKRARAKFAAMARARAKNPVARKRRVSRKRTTTVVAMHNPIRKRRTHVRKHTAVAKRRHHRRRHNPIGLGSFIRKPMAMIAPALTGAIGAAAVNTILGKLPVPAVAMTGKARYLTQGVAAIALATIASKLGIKGAMAAQMAEGSLTVTMHQAIVDIAGGMGVNLSGMGYYLPGVRARAIPSASGNSAPMAMAGMGRYLTGPGARTASVTPIAAKTGLKGFNR